MKRSFRFSLPVTVVTAAIGYVYASTVFVFIDQWFGLRSSPGIMNAAAFTAVALMSAVNYAVAVFTDPGRIPSTFMPDIEDADNPIHEIKRKYHEGVRAMWLAEKGGDVYSHPYNVGAYENLTSALGPNILCWLFPTSRHIGSGLRFPSAYEKLASASASK
ncbi:DHHC-type zinc finger family protein [Actinidia rufa]|uniref:DHHC-type zinc finger family protein n=1 Tax=Actinidia rufa TaxID=165716 RepID=A0A7J0GJI8_9ERIC|nr:DHHC-type zinc finger family protein [Actinidia rufa]